MNKLEMAHDYFMKHGRDNSWMEHDVIDAWKYADLMQAQADEREDKTRPAVLQEEWQPDWSQAPDTAIAWEMRYGSNTEARWCHDKDKAGFSYTVAPSFNYQGNWHDSLRKRPE